MKTRIKVIKYKDDKTAYQPQKKTFLFWEDFAFEEDTLLEAQCVIDRRIERYKKEKQNPKISYIKYP